MCSLGRGNAGRCAVRLYVGEGLRGSNGARSTLHQISVTASTTHNQIGPLWCWFPSGWACAHFRPLWVSPMTSPVRLEVSPAAVPTPMGAYNQRFEALFPRAGALGCVVCLGPRHLSGLSVCEGGAGGATHHSDCPVLRHSESGPLGLSVRKCRVPGSASGRTACPVHPTLLQSWSRHGNVSPLCPGCPSPPLLWVWMNVYFLSPWCRTSLPFDFLSVLVVRGGTVCLPTLPSSFSAGMIFIFFKKTVNRQ